MKGKSGKLGREPFEKVTAEYIKHLNRICMDWVISSGRSYRMCCCPEGLKPGRRKRHFFRGWRSCQLINKQLYTPCKFCRQPLVTGGKEQHILDVTRHVCVYQCSLAVFKKEVIEKNAK